MMTTFREDIDDILSGVSALEEKLSALLTKVADVRNNTTDYPEANVDQNLFASFLIVHKSAYDFLSALKWKQELSQCTSDISAVDSYLRRKGQI
jgi:hypothetical protein